MRTLEPTDLIKLARDAARAVAGVNAEDVAVRAGEDSTGYPSYFFFMVVDRDHAPADFSLFRTRLSQKIRDDLLSREDSHYPFVQILSRSDWDTLKVA